MKGISLVRPSNRMMIVVAALLCAIGTTAVITYQSKLGCWLTGGNYKLVRSIYIKVESNRSEELFLFLRSFGDIHNMWFAIDRYPAGKGGYDHDTSVAELFDCSADIIVENNQSPELFGLHFARNSSADSAEFEKLQNQFVSDLTNKFELQPTPKM